MSEFERWYKENHPNVEPIDVWNHQQKKIDAIKNILSDELEYDEVLIEKIKELLKLT